MVFFPLRAGGRTLANSREMYDQSELSTDDVLLSTERY